MKRLVAAAVGCASVLVLELGAQQPAAPPRVGQELAVARHLRDGDELRTPVAELIAFGRTLFQANWTDQDGAGRPGATGAGRPLADRSRPLTGRRAFNRISGPDANSCQGCHNLPHGLSGGGGDFVTGIFAGAEQYDFVNFDHRSTTPAGSPAGAGKPEPTLGTVGRPRASPGLFGAGYIELLARQMTVDLQAIRDTLPPGGVQRLSAKGVSFGSIGRTPDGRWDTRAVTGLSAESLAVKGGAKPSLVIRPWRQSGDIVSLRDFTLDALNRSHGIQATERFGVGTDPDRDGVVNEVTRADVTALVLFQATLPVPGQVIPRDAAVEQAIKRGEQLFDQAACSVCHVRALPLTGRGWVFTEPAAPAKGTPARRVQVDLTDMSLPLPRLAPPADSNGVLDVPAFTDLKLHDVSGSGERFLTRRLWGAANEPPYWHDGSLTTLRSAVRAHRAEANASREHFERLAPADQDALIEFLKSLQVLPPGTRSRIVDEHYRPR